MSWRGLDSEKILKALTPTGVRILREILREGKPVRPRHLKKALGLPYSTLSYHFSLLEEAGLIGILRLGEGRRYLTLVYPRVSSLRLKVSGEKVEARCLPAEGFAGSEFTRRAVELLYRRKK